MKQSLLFIATVSFTILVLSIIQVTVSNRLSTTGIVLSKLEEQINHYRRENALLAEKVLYASSFTTIASSAASLGFVDSKSAIYLSTPLPVAMDSHK